MNNRRISSGTKNSRKKSMDPLSPYDDPANATGISVAVRIRPLTKKEIESGLQPCCQSIRGEPVIAITKSGDINGYLKSQLAITNEYAFDMVFNGSTTQTEVYERTTKPYIPFLLQGKNVTVFAYGATGAGKNMNDRFVLV